MAAGAGAERRAKAVTDPPARGGARTAHAGAGRADAHTSPPVTGQAAALGLQRTAGNAATAALLSRVTLQTASAAGGAAGAALADPMLRVGARGEAVRLLQDHLVQSGAAVSVDGAFGPITRAAVTAFQRAAGLTPDGIVGPLTWAGLKAGAATVAPPPGPSPFTQAGLTEKISARLQGIAAKLRAVAEPAGGLGGGSGGSMERFGALGSAGAGHHPSLATVLGGSASGFAPTGGGPTPQSDAGGSTAPPAEVAGIDLGAVMPAAAQVIELVAQPQVAEALGSVAGDLTGTVAPLAAGVTDVPLDQIAAQLSTLTADVGQAVANQVGQATGTGSTTVAVVRDITYKITGTTIAEVGQALDIHMAIHGEAGHVAQIQPDPSKPANDTTNKKGAHMSVVPDEAGKVASATIVVNLERELPEWTHASSTKCACWKAEWERFDQAIRAHEQEHVNKEKSFFAAMHTKVIGKTEDDAYALFFKVAEDLDAAQAAFDERTKHGQDPSPGTKFNAGRSCTC